MTESQPERRSRSPEATRKRILSAAEAIFAERGYAGARVQQIVDRAHVNKRMVYHYFGSKLDLYVAVITERFSELAEASSSAARKALAGGDPLTALSAVVGAYFDVLERRPRYAKLIRWEAASGWTVLNRVRPTLRAELGQLMVDILNKGKTTGEFDESIDSDFVWWLILGVPSHYYFDRPHMQKLFEDSLTSPELVRHHRDQIVQFVCRAVQA